MAEGRSRSQRYKILKISQPFSKQMNFENRTKNDINAKSQLKSSFELTVKCNTFLENQFHFTCIQAHTVRIQFRNGFDSPLVLHCNRFNPNEGDVWKWSKFQPQNHLSLTLASIPTHLAPFQNYFELFQHAMPQKKAFFSLHSISHRKSMIYLKIV